MGVNFLYYLFFFVEDEIEVVNGDVEVLGVVVGNEVVLLVNNDVGIDEVLFFGEVVLVL